uniref:DOG1 domain n=1 Tax=Saccharum spontaneum TaxID=62335 RepID=A0A678T4G3_SACSP|nr:DOG1 domain [Saccharum spontaneum]
MRLEIDGGHTRRLLVLWIQGGHWQPHKTALPATQVAQRGHRRPAGRLSQPSQAPRLFPCRNPGCQCRSVGRICEAAGEQQAETCTTGAGTPESSPAGVFTFDIEYARRLEDQNKQINELSTAVNAHASDSDLRLILDGVMAHYDEIFK